MIFCADEVELRWWFCNSGYFQMFPQYVYNYKVTPLQRSDRTRGSGHKLKYLKIRKIIVTARVVKLWNRLTREFAESSSLEM